MSRPAIEEILDVLGHRWNLLDTLADGPHSKPELETSLDVSRSTINRAISELEQVDLIEPSTSNGYQLSAFGRPIYHLCSSTGQCLDGIYEAYPFGSQFPTGEYGEAVMFDDATVVRPEPHTPDRPLQELLDRIRAANSLRGCTPVVLNQYIDVCYEQIRFDSLNMELVVTAPVRECLETTYLEQFSAALQQPNVNVFETETIPFGIILFDEGPACEAGLVIYSNTGISGLVTTESDHAIGWAKQFYQRCKAHATEVPVTTVGNITDSEERQ